MAKYGSSFGLWVLVLCSMHSGILAAKVLVIPANINSHVIYFGQLGIAIATNGDDDVTMLVPSNAKVPASFLDSAMKVEKYATAGNESVINSDAFADIFLTSGMSESMFGPMQAMAKIDVFVKQQMNTDCDHKFKPEVMKRIRDAGYNFMIVDPADIACGTTFPYALDVRYGILAVPFAPAQLYRCPALPSFTPGIFADKFSGMTFWHRLTNVLAEALLATFQNRNTTYVQTHASHRPLLTPAELNVKSSLWFVLDTLGFNYPGPSMPNMVHVGDVMARPAKPLPGDLLSFLDSATEGVVLVSQGSYMNQIPDQVLYRLCNAFKRISLKVLWKIRDLKDCALPADKVKVVQWMPQNDILAHPHLKVFFTHGGINGAIESVYHAKPMLVMPFALDQPLNAALIEDRKFGLKVSLSTLDEDDLVEKLLQLVNDKEIAESVQHASKVIRNAPESAGRRASFWINHVVQNGDEHLRTGAFDLNIVQFYMMDVFLFLMLGVQIILLIFVLCCCCVCKQIRKCCSRSPQDKLKTS